MFRVAKMVMVIYMSLLANMVECNPSIMSTKMNFEFFCDVNLFIYLSCLLPMLKTIHALIKFA